MTPATGSESRFNAESTALEVIAGHDLSGKETIVTGGYSGLGFETAKALAAAGAAGRAGGPRPDQGRERRNA